MLKLRVLVRDDEVAEGVDVEVARGVALQVAFEKQTLKPDFLLDRL